MAIDWAQVENFVVNMGQSALPVLGAMAAVGTLSMALLQTAKDMLPLRKWFHRWKLKHWLGEKANKASMHGHPHPDIYMAIEDLIRLATAGDPDAFYDLEIEQLCGQMNAAAQAILDYPDRHQDLLRCLAAMAEKDDINKLLEPLPPEITYQPKPQELVDARARVIHQVQRAIDGFQISAGFRWKWILQGTSFILSFLITMIAVAMWTSAQPGTGEEGKAVPRATSVIQLLLVGVVGGFLAPVARDLLASLKKLRS